MHIIYNAYHNIFHINISHIMLHCFENRLVQTHQLYITIQGCTKNTISLILYNKKTLLIQNTKKYEHHQQQNSMILIPKIHKDFH